MAPEGALQRLGSLERVEIESESGKRLVVGCMTVGEEERHRLANQSRLILDLPSPCPTSLVHSRNNVETTAQPLRTT